VPWLSVCVWSLAAGARRVVLVSESPNCVGRISNDTSSDRRVSATASRSRRDDAQLPSRRGVSAERPTVGVGQTPSRDRVYRLGGDTFRHTIDVSPESRKGDPRERRLLLKLVCRWSRAVVILVVDTQSLSHSLSFHLPIQRLHCLWELCHLVLPLHTLTLSAFLDFPSFTYLAKCGSERFGPRLGGKAKSRGVSDARWPPNNTSPCFSRYSAIRASTSGRKWRSSPCIGHAAASPRAQIVCPSTCLLRRM
jgi:hypothetical protein